MTEKRFRVHELVRYNYSEIGEYIDENHTDRPLRNDVVVELLNNLNDENKQLKKDVEYWKQVASQYSNELNVFEHCKKYKTECKDIHWSSE